MNIWKKQGGEQRSPSIYDQSKSLFRARISKEQALIRVLRKEVGEDGLRSLLAALKRELGENQ